MALDFYVGTMTRFYRREWENVVQREAREQGIEYQLIYADGDAPLPEAEEVREAVVAWCEALSAALSPHGIAPLGWSEAEDAPYFTNRPAWSGYLALLLWAAHDEHPELELPLLLPENWDEDEAYARASARGSQSAYGHLLKANLWVPTDFDGVINARNITGQPAQIGSTFALRRQLDALYERSHARLAALAERGEAEFPLAPVAAPDAQEKPGLLTRMFKRNTASSAQGASADKQQNRSLPPPCTA